MRYIEHRREHTTDTLPSALDSYFNNIDRETYRPVGQERVNCIAKRIREGDTEARDELIRRNLWLVVYFAKKHARRNSSGNPDTDDELFHDFIGEGNIGLIKAVETYDENMGAFTTYAGKCIEGYILKSYPNYRPPVKTPVNVHEILGCIGRAKRALRQELEREPTYEEISERAGMPVKKVRRITEGVRKAVSLHSSTHDSDERLRLLDVLADGNSSSPDEEAYRSICWDLVVTEIKRLPEKEGLVLALHYGFDKKGPMVLEEIGKNLENEISGNCGLTRERVRQIEERALKRLRKPSRIKRLEKALGCLYV